jgi:hypothetical protein
MTPFLQKLWQGPARVPLLSSLTAAIGIVVNHLIGQSGKVELTPTLATDILLSVGALLFSVGGVAYSYWKRFQPIEMVEWARHRGRPICHCTEVGTIMLVLPQPQSSVIVKLYKCPKCGEVELVNQPVKTV